MQLKKDGINILLDYPLVSGCPIRMYGNLILDGTPLSHGDIAISADSLEQPFLRGDKKVAEIRDILKREGDLLVVERTWTLLVPGKWVLKTGFTVDFPGTAEALIPAVMYKENREGQGSFPRGSDGWSFLESRTPLPSCVGLYGGGEAFFCCTEPGRCAETVSSATAELQPGRSTVEIWIPGSEFPSVYTGKKNLEPALPDELEALQIKASDIPYKISRTFYCRAGDAPGGSPFSAYSAFVEALEGQEPFSRPVTTALGWDRYAQLKTAHLFSLVETYEGGKGLFFTMGRNNGALQPIYNFTAGSFLVKSLEGAVILARIGEKELAPFLEEKLCSLGDRIDEEVGEDAGAYLWALAERVGRFFLQGETIPGIHRDCYDPLRKIWGGYLGISEHDAYRHLVNARCNGEVMRSYLDLYEKSVSRGKPVVEFLELPRRVASFYLKNQLKGENAGSFGRWWSLDGDPVDSLGTNGAYIVSFLCALEPYEKDPGPLVQALGAAGNFYLELADRGEFFGDTLDADSCDKESGVALLTMFLDLYERDGNPEWMTGAAKAADFVLSWVWQYDCWFSPATPLGCRKFRTTGMTSVSVAHHHLDFYGMLIAYEFLRYAEFSGRILFKRQAVLMMSTCQQLMADQEDLLGREEQDLGWQPEQINHTRWDYFGREAYTSGHFDIDIAWVTILGLGAYQRICRRYPAILEEGEGLRHE